MGHSSLQASTVQINYPIEICFRIGIFILFLLLENAAPFIRAIHPEEIWLYQYPKAKIPFLADLGGPILKWTLDPRAIFCYPLLAILIRWYYTRDNDEMCRMYLIPTLATPLTGAVVNIIKNSVGRPRPNFMVTCYGEYYYSRYTDVSRPCTGIESQVLNGRKSFPSGHSGLAFASFGFLALYVADRGKIIWLDKTNRWKVIATFLPLALSPTLVAISRTSDYKHHWEDVLVGSLIGTVVTTVVYQLYCPRSSTSGNESPSSSQDAAVMYSSEVKQMTELDGRSDADYNSNNSNSNSRALFREGGMAVSRNRIG